MTHAVYAGSFDPIHFGHLDIIKRAAKMFDRLTVLVGNNPKKQYTFKEAHHRAGMVQACLKNVLNVKVERLNGQRLLVDWAFENRVNVIVKGVRNLQDFDYEKAMHEINLSQQHGIETFLMFGDPKLGHISSSAVKELEKHSGFIHQYVPLRIKAYLEDVLGGRKVIGVTGGIASGKNYFCEKIQERAYNFVTVVDMDKIAHNILFEREEPVYVDLRKTIEEEFNIPKLARKSLGDVVFADPAKLERLNQLMRVPLLTCIRETIGARPGLILLNGALLVEFGLTFLCNNNVILVTAKKAVRKERMKFRGYSDEQIERRLKAQYDDDTKLIALNASIQTEGYGSLHVVESPSEDDYRGISKWIDRFPGTVLD